MILFYWQTFPQPLTTFSSLSVENSITLVTKNWLFWPSNLFQGNCIRRSNKKVNQTTYFTFAEMSWTPAEHEDRGTGAEGLGPDKSNSPFN